MNKIKQLTALTMTCAMALTLLSGCGDEEAIAAPSDISPVSDESVILLSDDGVSMNGEALGDSGEVYLSHDIIYYEDRMTYGSGHAYGEGEDWEMHSAEEAAAHTVVNITAPGSYRLSGSLSQGQIRVDLGEDAFTDPTAAVTLILDGVDISCAVAPAILFLNTYECDNGWSAETATALVDTATAGANIVLADGSSNSVNGSHVARIYKDGGEEKKLWKQDAAVYSYMSMNVDGEDEGSGVLNISADNEGLDTELHLTINGGHINIYAGNDGINTNEDGVSVTTINGGVLHIVAGLGEEGDGIDSNGWLLINGGTVIASANPAADAGLDSDMGSYVNGGTVLALGSTMDWAESDSAQVTMNLQFSEYKDSGDAIAVTDMDGKVIFAYDPSEDEVLGSNTRQYMGAVISCPGFRLGESYQVYVGGTLSGGETAGVYDPDSVTDYTGGVQQAYTGTDVMMRPGGMGGFPGGERPEWPGAEEFPFPEGGFEPGERPEMPGAERPEMPPTGEMPAPPEGEWPEMPEGGFGGRPGTAMPEGDGAQADTVFFMQDKVNSFSGVGAAE